MSAPQLFVAALGACLLEFVLNSCRLNNVPVSTLSVDVSYEEMVRPRRIGAMQAVIRLDPRPQGDLSRKLMAVARRATLASTLLRPPHLDIAVVGEGEESDADL